MNTLGKIKNGMKSIFVKDFSSYNGAKLPPPGMRIMGDKFLDDKYYYESSVHEGERLVNQLGVSSATKLLEIGCSSGRTIIGLLEKVPKISQYVGVDAKKFNISWCNKHIGRKNPFCKFVHVDLKHIIYNTNGTIELNENFRYPFNNEYFDVVYLNSILPNNIDSEIKILAKEFYRLLKPGGKLFLTTFIEENVPNMTENPENYIMKCIFPRQIVRYEKNFFIKLFTNEGFTLDRYEQGTEIDFQSAVYLSKK